MPPPLPSAALPLITLSGSVTAPLLHKPTPPPSLVELFPVMMLFSTWAPFASRIPIPPPPRPLQFVLLLIVFP